MDHAPMSIVTFLTASAAFVMLVGGVLALPASFALLRFYRARLLSLMNRTARSAASSPVPVAAPRAAGAAATSAELVRAVRRGPTRDLVAYGAGILVYASAMAAANQLALDERTFYPLRFAVLVTSYAFPAVPVYAYLRGRARDLGAAITGYVVLLVGLGILAAMAGSSFAAPFQLLAFDAPASLAIAGMYLARNGRAGPLVYSFIVFALIGPNVAMLFLDWNLRSVAIAATALGATSPLAVIGSALVLGLVSFVLAGVVFLAGVRWSYVAKWISDRSLAVDSLLLPYAISHSAIMMFDDLHIAIVTPIVALTGYRIAVLAVQRSLGAATARGERGATVLFLRVFRATGRSDLFARWSASWRFAGSIRMIAGPDLATTTVEPHELLDFVFGRLASRFIESPDDLSRALAHEDLRPDLDGRHRVADYFCRKDTWQMVFRRLAETSDAILIDLRGLRAEHAGARLELEAVAAHVDLHRVVVVVDAQTDRVLLDRALAVGRGAARIVAASDDPETIAEALCHAAGAPPEVPSLAVAA